MDLVVTIVRMCVVVVVVVGCCCRHDDPSTLYMQHRLRTVIIGPGNGSPSATNVVLLVILNGVLLSDFDSLRLCRFSTDRDETFHKY